MLSNEEAEVIELPANPCKHEFLTDEGACTVCGLTKDLFGTEGPTFRTSDRGIMKDMENYPIQDDAKLKAQEIWEKINSATKRGQQRKLLIFFCLFHAYNELGKPQDPKWLASIVGIKASQMTNALSSLSPGQTGYQPPIIQVTAIHILPAYCELLKLAPETTNDVLIMAKRILEKDEELNETFPQKVAAGILLHYAIVNGILRLKDRKKYAELIGLSDVTISAMYRRVSEIDNL